MKKSRVRIFATYCLLLLLPLQAVAAMKVYACAISMVNVKATTMEMSASMPDCKLHKAEANQQTHSITDQDFMSLTTHSELAKSPCKMLTVCNVIILIATLPHTNNMDSGFSNNPLIIFTPSAYLSFVSDELQRPPNLRT
jgi:hypothetical protein